MARRALERKKENFVIVPTDRNQLTIKIAMIVFMSIIINIVKAVKDRYNLFGMKLICGKVSQVDSSLAVSSASSALLPLGSTLSRSETARF
jgi:hypothetical protein